MQAELIRRDYTANGGWETFLSYEDPEQDILIGLLRLRKCSEDTYRLELKGGCSIVRELHVYGTAVPVHARDPTKFQHQVSTVNLKIFQFSVTCNIHMTPCGRNPGPHHKLGCAGLPFTRITIMKQPRYSFFNYNHTGHPLVA